jgi:hypothetical protein
MQKFPRFSVAGTAIELIISLTGLVAPRSPSHDLPRISYPA